jgi:hypothetical protein
MGFPLQCELCQISWALSFPHTHNVQYKSPSGGVLNVLIGSALFSLVLSDLFVPSIAAAVVSVIHMDDI